MEQVRHKKNRFLFIILLFPLLLLSSCRWQTKWFQLDCSWKNDEYEFIINQGGSADLTFEDIQYKFDFGVDNTGKNIDFNLSKNQESIYSVTEDGILMSADVTCKNDFLYLTFTKDEIADLLGKTLVFYKVNND